MKVNKTCDFLLGQGIFTALNDLNVPWKDKNISLLLDTEYYTTFGNRQTSPLVDYLIGDKEQLSTEDTQKLAHIIFNKFSDNWNRIDLAFSKEYNPIWNKDGTETTTVENSAKTTTYEKGNQTNRTTKGEQINTNGYGEGQTTESQGATKTTNAYGAEEKTESLGKTKTTNSYGEDRTTTANGERQTKDSGKTITTENKTSAFNSSTYQDDTQTTEKDGGNTVTQKAVTDTTTKAAKTDSVTTDAVTNTETTKAKTDSITTDAVTNTTTEKAKTDTFTEGQREDTFTDGARTDTTQEGETTQTTTYSFGGNIGVTTTQEMLTAEFDMREKYNFFDIIFRNVDSILSCGYYLTDC